MGDFRYENTKTLRESETGRKYLLNNLYPPVPVDPEDIYVITTAGDRFDLLSQQFYYTSEYWWIILLANELSVDTICPEPGMQIRIPAHPVSYIEQVRLENS